MNWIVYIVILALWGVFGVFCGIMQKNEDYETTIETLKRLNQQKHAELERCQSYYIRFLKK